jgi:hypothetical protein
MIQSDKSQRFILSSISKCNVSRKYKCSSPKLVRLHCWTVEFQHNFNCDQIMKQEMTIHRYKRQITRFACEAFNVIQPKNIIIQKKKKKTFILNSLSFHLQAKTIIHVLIFNLLDIFGFVFSFTFLTLIASLLKFDSLTIIKNKTPMTVLSFTEVNRNK